MTEPSQEARDQRAIERAVAAQQIDPYTCLRWRDRGVDGEERSAVAAPPIADGELITPVFEHELRELHPEITDAEWDDLMVDAERRYDEADLGPAPWSRSGRW